MILRVPLLLFSLFSVGTRIIIDIISGPTPIHTLRFFTEQTNLMILIWTFLALIWQDNDKYEKLTGLLKGALTTYITVTFLVFHIIITKTYHPIGIDWWTSLFNHYINPILFIIDYFAFERVEYQWKWPIYWLIYPLFYLIFEVVWSATTGEFLYPFLNYDVLGIGGFFIWVGILFGLFLILGFFYTIINRRILHRLIHKT